MADTRLVDKGEHPSILLKNTPNVHSVGFRYRCMEKDGKRWMKARLKKPYFMCIQQRELRSKSRSTLRQHYT